MKRILLAPYPGDLYFTRSLKDYQREHTKREGAEDIVPAHAAGRMAGWRPKGFAMTYLVYVSPKAGITTLAHEMGHVVLDLFENVGIDPIASNGEPFCYMQAHLMDEALRR